MIDLQLHGARLAKLMFSAHQRIFATTCIENRTFSSNIKFNMNSTNNSNVAGDGNRGGHSLAYSRPKYEPEDALVELGRLYTLKPLAIDSQTHSLAAKIDKRIKILEVKLSTDIAPCI